MKSDLLAVLSAAILLGSGCGAPKQAEPDGARAITSHLKKGMTFRQVREAIGEPQPTGEARFTAAYPIRNAGGEPEETVVIQFDSSGAEGDINRFTVTSWSVVRGKKGAGAVETRPAGEARAKEESGFESYIKDPDCLGVESRRLVGASPRHGRELETMLENPKNSGAWPKVIYALGYIGNDQSTRAILTFVQRKTRPDEAQARFGAVLEAPNALGVAAQRNDQAYEVLKQGIHPEFWASWAEGYAYSDGRAIPAKEVCSALVRGCLNGIGASGRAEARQFIGKLVEDGSREYLYDYWGGICQAVFYLDWIEKYGVQSFRKELLSPVHGERWQEWKKPNKGFIDWGYDPKLPDPKPKVHGKRPPERAE